MDTGLQEEHRPTVPAEGTQWSNSPGIPPLPNEMTEHFTLHGAPEEGGGGGAGKENQSGW